VSVKSIPEAFQLVYRDGAGWPYLGEGWIGVVAVLAMLAAVIVVARGGGKLQEAIAGGVFAAIVGCMVGGVAMFAWPLLLTLAVSVGLMALTYTLAKPAPARPRDPLLVEAEREVDAMLGGNQ
jgi:hypothetical protein